MDQRKLTTHPEDERRTAIAIVLSVLVIVAYQHLFLAPPPAQYRAAPDKGTVLEQTSPTTPQAQLGSDSNIATNSGDGLISAPTNTASPQRPPIQEEIDQQGSITFESEKFIGTITRLGGRLSSLKLKEYKDTTGEAALLDMVEAIPGSLLPLGVYGRHDSDAFVVYEVVASSQQGATDTIVPNAEGILSLTLKGQTTNGEEIVKRVTIDPGSYILSVEASIKDGSGPLWIEWADTISAANKNTQWDPPHFTKLTAESSLEHVQLSDVVSEQQGAKDLGLNRWVAFGRKYFLVAMLPATEQSAFVAGKKGDGTYIFRTPIDSKGGKVSVYAGPKKEEELGNAGRGLKRAIDLGVFTVIAHPLLGILRFFHALLNNWGLAIILLTICVKLALFWLSKKSFDSMQKMQEIQPEVQALRERVKDPTALNQEMMALYKARGVNPLGGCLPMLAQIPVFFALYSALGNSIELRHAPFALWINDLSAPERLMAFGIPIPVMILIMGATFVWQQQSQPTTVQDPTQKRIMMMMPVIFTVMMIVFPIPAGLVLYMLVNNILSITQQIYLRNVHGTHPLIATSVASIALFLFGYGLTLI